MSPALPFPGPAPRSLQAHLDPALIIAVWGHRHLPAAELGQHVLVFRQQFHRELVQAAGVAAARVPDPREGASARRALLSWYCGPCLLQKFSFLPNPAGRYYQCPRFTDQETEARERKDSPKVQTQGLHPRPARPNFEAKASPE